MYYFLSKYAKFITKKVQNAIYTLQNEREILKNVTKILKSYTTKNKETLRVSLFIFDDFRLTS